MMLVVSIDLTDLLTSPEVAQILGCSNRTVHRLAMTGGLVPARRLSVGPNGAFLFRRQDVEQVAAERRSARVGAA